MTLDLYLLIAACVALGVGAAPVPNSIVHALLAAGALWFAWGRT